MDSPEFNARGNVYFRKGQYEQAISDYNKAIEINSRLSVAYYNRGISYFYKGEYEKSLGDIIKAQQLGFRIPSEFLDDLRKAFGGKDI